MIYLWFILQFTPPLIGLWLHSKKTKEVFFTKETIMNTIGSFMVMSFFIVLLTYGVMFLNDPNEIVQLELFTGGRLQDVGFVLKYGVISLISSIIVGNMYSFNVKEQLLTRYETNLSAADE